MTRAQLRTLQEGHAFNPSPRHDQLYAVHVPFDELIGGHGCEGALERALRLALTRGSVSAESVAYLLGESTRATKAPRPVEIPLPDDPRVRVTVRPHALDAYDRLTSPETDDE